MIQAGRGQAPGPLGRRGDASGRGRTLAVRQRVRACPYAALEHALVREVDALPTAAQRARKQGDWLGSTTSVFSVALRR